MTNQDNLVVETWLEENIASPGLISMDNLAKDPFALVPGQHLYLQLKRYSIFFSELVVADSTLPLSNSLAVS